VRDGIGLSSAGMAYAGPAWSMNVGYARLKPDGIFSTFPFLGAMLGFFRVSFRISASILDRLSRVSYAEIYGRRRRRRLLLLLRNFCYKATTWKAGMQHPGGPSARIARLRMYFWPDLRRQLGES
jgi:hypothetical protein